MKKFVLWLIKVFKLDIPTEKVKVVPAKTVVKEVYVLKSTEYEHDLRVNGDLTVRGNLHVKGELSCYNKEELL